SSMAVNRPQPRTRAVDRAAPAATPTPTIVPLMALPSALVTRFPADRPACAAGWSISSSLPIRSRIPFAEGTRETYAVASSTAISHPPLLVSASTQGGSNHALRQCCLADLLRLRIGRARMWLRLALGVCRRCQVVQIRQHPCLRRPRPVQPGRLSTQPSRLIRQQDQC